MLLLLGVLVDQHDGGAELDLVAGQLRDVDDLGARDQVLELVDAALIEALRFLGGMVLGVLGKVAMRARFGDRLDDARPLFLLAPAQLFLELAEPIGGHRDLVHFLQPFLSGRSFARRAPDIDSNCETQKENGPELRLPEPLHLIRINIASFVRFSRQKLACSGASPMIATATRPHRIVNAIACGRASRPALPLASVDRRT